MTVHFPSDLDVMQMWMSTGNQVITVADGQPDEVDAVYSRVYTMRSQVAQTCSLLEQLSI